LPAYREPPFLVTCLFLVFVWAKYIQATARLSVLQSIRFELLLGAPLVAICIFLLTGNKYEMKRAKHVAVGIALLFLVMLTQIPFAAVPEIASKIFEDRVVKFAAMTLFIAVLVRSPRNLKWFLVVYMISIFWVTQEAVRGLISGGLVWQNQGVMRLHGAVPIYEHPNSLGGVAMGAVPFVVFLWPVFARWWQRLALLALLTTSLVCVIYSGSRTAYVALAAFIVFWFLSSRKKGRFIARAAVIFTIALFVVPDEYIGRFESITGEEAEGHSKDTRIQIYEDAWEIFLENPGGVGVGCFPFVRLRKFGRFQDTHNLYLEVATNLGIHGFVVFCYFVGAMMVGYYRARGSFSRQLALLRRSARMKPKGALRQRMIQQSRDLQLFHAAGTAAAGFIFVRLVLGMFGMDLYEIYWWFGAGIAIGLLQFAPLTERMTRALVEMQASASEENGGLRPQEAAVV
jgi:O-antigen ligase